MLERRLPESAAGQTRAAALPSLKAAWQRFYFKGQYPDGEPAERAHSNKLRVEPPVDMRPRKGRVGG